jgi:hypothetical protein
MRKTINKSGKKNRKPKGDDEHFEIKMLIKHHKLVRPKDSEYWVKGVMYLQAPWLRGGDTATTYPLENYKRKIKGVIKENNKYKYVDLYTTQCAYGRCKNDCGYCDRLNGLLKQFDNSNESIWGQRESLF